MLESIQYSALPTAEALIDSVPERWLRHVPGRETFAWPLVGDPVLAVKRFGVGGSDPVPGRGGAPHWRDRWYALVRRQARRSPAQIEYDNLVALRDAGFAVPEPVDWAEDRARGISVVLMAWIGHRETLRDRLQVLGRSTERSSGSDPLRDLLGRLAQFVARFHLAGFYHRDLYLHHFVLGDAPETSGEPSLRLLDLGRVRRERSPRTRWLIKDLGALAYSFPDAVTASEREAFFQRYFDLAGPATLSARTRWLRAIRRRCERIAAHVPRHSGLEPHE